MTSIAQAMKFPPLVPHPICTPPVAALMIIDTVKAALPDGIPVSVNDRNVETVPTKLRATLLSFFDLDAQELSITSGVVVGNVALDSDSVQITSYNTVHICAVSD